MTNWLLPLKYTFFFLFDWNCRNGESTKQTGSGSLVRIPRSWMKSIITFYIEDLVSQANNTKPSSLWHRISSANSQEPFDCFLAIQANIGTVLNLTCLSVEILLIFNVKQISIVYLWCWTVPILTGHLYLWLPSSKYQWSQKAHTYIQTPLGMILPLAKNHWVPFLQSNIVARQLPYSRKKQSWTLPGGLHHFYSGPRMLGADNMLPWAYLD